MKTIREALLKSKALLIKKTNTSRVRVCLDAFPLRKWRHMLANAFVFAGIFLAYGFSSNVWAQGGGVVHIVAGQDETYRPLVPAVPILLLAPDARAGSLGDVGVATTPDINSVHWNNAKVAFMDKPYGVALSHTPWLVMLTDDMYISYLSGYAKIGPFQAVAASVRYFNIGNVFLRTQLGDNAGTFSPRDVAFDVTYSRKLSETFSMGLTMRGIYSTLSQGFDLQNGGNPALGFSVDLGAYYTKPNVSIFNVPTRISFGAHVSNVGTKISYGEDNDRNFLPANLRLGTNFDFSLDERSQISLALDLNKLLIPTPPIYQTNEDNELVRDDNGNYVIEKGMNPSRSVISGIFTSFVDAPDGFVEEMQEIRVSTGIQYWYNQLFSLQTGYHHEAINKGNRSFFTLGAGFRYSIFGLDFSYLIPYTRNHPLAQTLRFTLVFNFGKSSKTAEAEKKKDEASKPSIENESY